MNSTRPEINKKDRILLAGAKVFAEKGYHAVNVDDLIRASDVSRATFYAHFKSKEDFFSEIVDRLIEEQSAFVLRTQQSFLAAASDVGALLESIIETVKLEARRNRDALILFFDVIPGSGTRAEERFRRIQKVTLEHFTDMMRRAMETQGYSTSASKALAWLLVGGLSHVGRMIIYGEMAEPEIKELIAGMKELAGNRIGENS